MASLRERLSGFAQTRAVTNALIVVDSCDKDDIETYIRLVKRVVFCLECENPAAYNALGNEASSIPENLKGNKSWTRNQVYNAWTRGSKLILPKGLRFSKAPLDVFFEKIQTAYLDAYEASLSKSASLWLAAAETAATLSW